MFKKLKIVFITLFSFTLLLAGCSSNEQSSNEATENTNETETSDETKKLRVVTDAAYAPMEYLDGNEEVGFDIDLIHAVAEQAGYEIDVEHVGWDPIFVEIEGGTAHLAISSITITEERKESYNFTNPYYESRNLILVNDDSDIQAATDLEGETVAVQINTTGHEIAKKIENTNIKPFDSTPAAIQELLAGGAVAVIADKPVVDEYIKNNPDQNLKTVQDDSFEVEYYGILFPKDSEHVEAFNKALNEIFDNGKYAEIYKEWFGEDPDIDALKAQQ